MEYQLPEPLGEQIYLVAQMEDKYTLAKLKKLQLTADTSNLITYVNNHPGTRQKEINRALNKQAATITNMIKRLESRNLLIRRIDPNNSREKQVFLLKDGLDMVNKINEVTEEISDLLNPCVTDSGNVNIEAFYNNLLIALQQLGIAE